MSKDHAERIAHAAVQRHKGLRMTNAATEELKSAIRAAIDAGMTEKRAADLAGVTRMTVRAWLGK